RSTASRFAGYRKVIAVCLDLIRDMTEAPKDQDKVALVRALRARLFGPAAEGLDTAVVYAGDGRLQYPAPLGTGGNDGRLAFTPIYALHLGELLPSGDNVRRGDAVELLCAALFGDAVAGLSPGKAIGQFTPGVAGGPNSTWLG